VVGALGAVRRLVAERPAELVRRPELVAVRAHERVPEAVHAGMWTNLGRFFEAGVRNYDPRTRQFSAPDPLGVMGGLNVYGFAGNNRFLMPHLPNLG
jgi:hypothetical protein